MATHRPWLAPAALLERREWACVSYRVSPTARTHLTALCPFCGARMTVALLTLRGPGKRCGCGALLRAGGKATRRKGYAA